MMNGAWGFIKGVSTSKAVGLSLLTLNLHAYHPTGEAARYVESRAGVVAPVEPDLYFFQHDEIERGHRLRLDRLADDVQSLAPDLVFLQEVGAGQASGPKDCPTFYDLSGVAADRFEANSAGRLTHRLHDRGLDYQLTLACRGNVGWVTGPETLRDRRIVRFDAQGHKQVVFDYGASPYPQGMIVEGLAVLSSPHVKVLEAGNWSVAVDGTPDHFFVQVVAMAPVEWKAGQGWFVAVNVHGNHKLRHFEQAVAFRRALLNYIAWRTPTFGAFRGTVLGGDMNAQLHRPEAVDASVRFSEPGSIPWEVYVPGQIDYRLPVGAAALAAFRSGLIEELVAFNRDPNYKPQFTILDEKEARQRSERATDAYLALLKDGLPPLADGLNRSVALNTCAPLRDSLPTVLTPVCARDAIIDHMFFEHPEWVKSAAILYDENNWMTVTGTLTDHPGLLVNFEIP